MKCYMEVNLKGKILNITFVGTNIYPDISLLIRCLDTTGIIMLYCNVTESQYMMLKKKKNDIKWINKYLHQKPAFYDLTKKIRVW